MPLLEALPLNPTTAQWPVWSTTARLVVTDAEQLPAARTIATRQLAAVDEACSRFRADSELMTLAAGRPTVVSPLLAELVRTALWAAEFTSGLVTPTISSALCALGYDRDWAELQPTARPVPVRTRPAPNWRHVKLEGRQLTVPHGVRLDLGATGKAATADRIAAEIAAELGIGVLIALGGDIATAGPRPATGWHVLVQDTPRDPAAMLELPPHGALATSSTQSRRWNAGGFALHHILDPRNCRPAVTVWRTATVAANSCVRANAMSTAALILGTAAPQWLIERGHAARLVSADGDVVCVAGFPEQVQR